MADAIWAVHCEVLVERCDLPSGNRKAFVWITTWADSEAAVKSKVSRFLETHQWCLLGMEEANPIDETRSYGDRMMDMITRTRQNPMAIILGQFHSYKEN